MFGRIIDYHTKSEQRTIGVLLDKNLILHFIFHSQFILLASITRESAKDENLKNPTARGLGSR